MWVREWPLLLLLLNGLTAQQEVLLQAHAHTQLLGVELGVGLEVGLGLELRLGLGYKNYVSALRVGLSDSRRSAMKQTQQWTPTQRQSNHDHTEMGKAL